METVSFMYCSLLAIMLDLLIMGLPLLPLIIPIYETTVKYHAKEIGHLCVVDILYNNYSGVIAPWPLDPPTEIAEGTFYCCVRLLASCNVT